MYIASNIFKKLILILCGAAYGFGKSQHNLVNEQQQQSWY